MTETVLWTFGWTLIHGLWIGALVIGLAFFSCRLPRPRTRYGFALVLLASLTLSLPLTYAIVGDKPTDATTAGTLPAAPTNTEPLPPSASQRPAADSLFGVMSAASTPPQARWLTPLRESLPYLWMAGTGGGLLLLALGAVALWSLSRKARRIRCGRVTERAAIVAGSLGLKRSIRVATSDSIASPLVLGIFRPLVLLPTVPLQRWSEAELDLVLLHEFVHIQRHDNLVNMVQRVLGCALFFQPAAWWISRWLRHERELCCDEIVVRKFGSPDLYARTLLSLACAPRPADSLAIAMSRTPLVDRIAHILDKEHQPMKIPFVMSLPAAALAAGAFLMIDVQAQDPPPPAVAVDTVQTTQPAYPQAHKLLPGVVSVDQSAKTCTECHARAHRAASVSRAEWPFESTATSFQHPPFDVWPEASPTPTPSALDTNSATCTSCHRVLVPAATPRASSPQELTTYVVKHGDTLYRISKKLYKNVTHVPLLLEANPILKLDSNLKVGQHLNLLPGSVYLNANESSKNVLAVSPTVLEPAMDADFHLTLPRRVAEDDSEVATRLHERLMQLEKEAREIRAEIDSLRAGQPLPASASGVAR